MGLTKNSTGAAAFHENAEIRREEGGKIIALAGNPNVGKSTVFNALTGMNQHTGNWAGKTVSMAQGRCTYGGQDYILIDLPGTYSLLAHSKEEEVARDFICFGNPDCVVVVCDATSFERNVNLILQTAEITGRIVVCINLMDEAEKQNIRIDTSKLSERLNVPVAAVSGRTGEGLDDLMRCVDLVCRTTKHSAYTIGYPQPIEDAISELSCAISPCLGAEKNLRWYALRLLEEGTSFLSRIQENESELAEGCLEKAMRKAQKQLAQSGIHSDQIGDMIIAAIARESEAISTLVTGSKKQKQAASRKIDKILTGRFTGLPFMLLLLGIVFWITIAGANYPSSWLSNFFRSLEIPISLLLERIGLPAAIISLLVEGIYRVTSWVISVMLPPMAIFFPLFTLLEDLGYLPRVAFNLDHHFCKCSACGKQALTTCMGFGCNAAGVVGCRIIDSPRERLIAILTNAFIPCNGKFPGLIALIGMFFAGSGRFSSLKSSIILTVLILFSICMSFCASKLLSITLLKGHTSSFTLELPPYRRPQIGKIIIRSIFDRTLFVLGRAVKAAAPAGLLIWVFANVNLYGDTLIAHLSGFLDPVGKIMGLDGVILLAFILGFPANEIVIPIMLMGYLSSGSLVEMDNLMEMRSLLISNGWTWVTAVCMILFSLMHWPCATTCMTIKSETGSVGYTILGFILPALFGFVICSLISWIF